MEKENLISLVKQAQQSDPQALNDLFTETYNDVYYFALKTVKNETLAKDITQETFITIFQNIEGLNDPVAYPAWSRQITYRHCLQYIKKQDKEVLVEEDEDGNSIFDTVQEDRTEFIPDEALDKEDFKKTILEMVDGLPEEQRTAIILYYYDELSVKQIAEIQGVTEGTVKSRLNYARKAIKASVEDYEKKNNVKLHSFAIFPLMLWLLGGEAEGCTMSASAVKAVAGSITTATKTAVTLPSIVAKATMALWQKVVAGIVAAAIAVGGGIAVTNILSGKPEPRDTPVPDFTESQDATQQAVDESNGHIITELPLSSVVNYEDERYQLEITSVRLVDELPKGMLEIYYTITNRTDRPIEVFPRFSSINKISVLPLGWEYVPAKETVEGVFNFNGFEMYDNQIAQINEGKLVLRIQDDISYANEDDYYYIDGIELCYTINENYVQPVNSDGQPIYNDNGLKIVSQGYNPQHGGQMCFYAENVSSQVYYIDIRPVTPSGEYEEHPSRSMANYLDTGNRAYIRINLYDFLNQYDLENVEFCITIYELKLFTHDDGSPFFYDFKMEEFITDPLPLK